MIGISRMNNVITIAVENDGGDERPLVFENVRSFARRGSALPHGGRAKPSAGKYEEMDARGFRQPMFASPLAGSKHGRRVF